MRTYPNVLSQFQCREEIMISEKGRFGAQVRVFFSARTSMWHRGTADGHFETPKPLECWTSPSRVHHQDVQIKAASAGLEIGTSNSGRVAGK